MSWKNALLNSGASIQEAIQNLEKTSLQIVLVVNEDGILIGTITDGDIRRGLLSGLTIASPIESIMSRNSLVVPPEMGKELVLQMMHVNKVHQIPIIDSHHKVVGIHILDEMLLPSSRENLFVIMAGGKGVRLRPLTENCPKPLLPVAGKPMLEHIIEKAKSEGFHQFIILLHYLGYMIEEYFGDGKKWGVSIRYITETEPMGTAGGLRLLQEFPNEDFIVTNGDVLTDIRYGELLDFHKNHGAAATMAVRQYEWQHPYGVVQTEGVDIVGFEEKPLYKSHVNAGIYVLGSDCIQVIEKNAIMDMPTLFTDMQSYGKRIIVYPMHEPWVDVGRVDDYSAINELKKKNQ